MPRSLRVHPEYINQVKSAVKRNGYPRQRDLAEDLKISLATVNNFLNGKAVDYLNFIEICQRLVQEWQMIAEFDDDSDKQESIEEQEVIASDFYVERVPYESQFYQEILKPGALIRLKAPQQMGKTLLIERVLSQARAQGYQTLTLSFELADSTVFTDLRKFSQWFCASISQYLSLPNKLDEHWDDIFGCNSNTTAYFQDYLLPKIDSPLVVALDKVDLVFEHQEIANDFCRLLRSWYDIARRGDRSSVLWKKLRLVVVHSTEVYSSLDINHSPLAGVGLVVELQEFSPEQVQDLARRHGLGWSATQVERLMAMVGGHPHLVQLAFHHIKHQGITLEQILQTAPTEAGIYSNHLRRHLGTLQQHPELATAFSEVVKTDSWVTIESARVFKLHSMGLVKLQGNEVKPRCDLYRKYFCDRLQGECR
jgi:transcriptional regulator with XRE-family HTH domain